VGAWGRVVDDLVVAERSHDAAGINLHTNRIPGDDGLTDLQRRVGAVGNDPVALLTDMDRVIIRVAVTVPPNRIRCKTIGGIARGNNIVTKAEVGRVDVELVTTNPYELFASVTLLSAAVAPPPDTGWMLTPPPVMPVPLSRITLFVTVKN